ncbi:ECF RNA polymerase sigma factor SigL [Nocardioides aquaticus]|uniref:ECF RNA polymerase sigma factor SigL n=1 Tax=Nocardioides aquaticus TaxID=160826 RepID=A0ABX8EFB5_9ACTN|nr:sigma-70 family RNA polymerase sigma factor [Nocardioides aquaticus]QVT78580.1 ECF RNA polymerase sigma factor SigL [Nocardioides aquaticus]
MAGGDGFEARVEPLLEPLRRFLARRTDPDTAEDVLAETLLVLWRRRDELPVGEGALPWSYAVARLCLANADRSARRRRRLAARVAVVDPPPSTTDHADHADHAGDPGDPRADLVAPALAALPATDAEVLRLWAWEELAPREIAVVLGTTANAVSSRLSRARTRLAAELARQDDAGAGHRPTTRGDR